MPAPSVVRPPRYRFGDELASTLIHGVGILLSIAGLATWWRSPRCAATPVQWWLVQCSAAR